MVAFSKLVFLSLKVVIIPANSENPGEMQHYAAFHLGLHCLQKYPFLETSTLDAGIVLAEFHITNISTEVYALGLLFDTV